MSANNDKLKQLIDQYLQGNASAEERKELWRLVGNGSHDDQLDEHITATWSAEINGPSMDAEKRQAILQRIFASSGEAEGERVGRVRKMYRRRWMVAASIAALVLAGAGGFFYLNRARPSAEIASANKTNDILPGTTKGSLTLADGSVIILNDVPVGRLATQGRANIIKQDSGTLDYKQKENTTQPSAAGLNTLATPRGGQYDLILPDGSKVWLNAASSITFPASFDGSERNVELSGEAYFEIAANPNKPFHVLLKDGTQVQVLGTHFNVMAYEDERQTEVTLLEGSVNVVKQKAAVRLHPGEQALIGKEGNITKDGVDTSESVAWKNGLITFKDADIKTIMRQAARWYDVEVEYKGDVSQRIFTGSIARTSKLTQLLRILQLSNIHFNIEGRKIIVTG